jgi:hypothetical protein
MKTEPKDEEDDNTEDETDKTAALSALHQFADAVGVKIKDEDAALSAFEDLQKACAGY